jgi:hypothetical protein
MSNDDYLTSESGNQVPAYGTAPDQPGLYLALFHGRDAKDQQMNDWGFNGPLIGPLQWVHTTYACHVRALFESADAELRYFDNPEFPEARDFSLNDDLIEHAGKFYGDWSVFYVPNDETRKPVDAFRKVNRLNWPYRQEIQKLAA